MGARLWLLISDLLVPGPSHNSWLSRRPLNPAVGLIFPGRLPCISPAGAGRVRRAQSWGSRRLPAAGVSTTYWKRRPANNSRGPIAACHPRRLLVASLSSLWPLLAFTWLRFLCFRARPRRCVHCACKGADGSVCTRGPARTRVLVHLEETTPRQQHRLASGPWHFGEHPAFVVSLRVSVSAARPCRGSHRLLSSARLCRGPGACAAWAGGGPAAIGCSTRSACPAGSPGAAPSPLCSPRSRAYKAGRRYK